MVLILMSYLFANSNLDLPPMNFCIINFRVPFETKDLLCFKLGSQDIDIDRYKLIQSININREVTHSVMRTSEKLFEKKKAACLFEKCDISIHINCM